MKHTYSNILVDRDGTTGLITLNRPEVLNALSLELVSEVDAAITEMEQDEAIRAIIITGAGEKAFSAGADIHEMSKLTAEAQQRRQEQRRKYSWHLANCAKPTIGAINGLAYGGAALMSSCFDMRIGCERTKFRFLGVAYGRLNSSWSLPLVVGWARAKELLYTARVVEAEEAERMGLLNKMVSSARLLAEAKEMASLIAKNHPGMVQGAKQLLNSYLGLPWEEMFEQEEQVMKQGQGPVPVREAFREFLERKGRS